MRSFLRPPTPHHHSQFDLIPFHSFHVSSLESNTHTHTHIIYCTRTPLTAVIKSGEDRIDGKLMTSIHSTHKSSTGKCICMCQLRPSPTHLPTRTCMANALFTIIIIIQYTVFRIIYFIVSVIFQFPIRRLFFDVHCTWLMVLNHATNPRREHGEILISLEWISEITV